MKLTTKQLTLCAVLTALALALSYLENFFPLSLAIPIPGIKLGLANIVTVFALYALGPAQALLILAGRCLLGAVFAGNMNALIFSLLGGFSAMPVMIGLSRCRKLSIYGVSIGGAAAHNCGQIAAAVLTLWSTAPPMDTPYTDSRPGRDRRIITSMADTPPSTEKITASHFQFLPKPFSM